MDLETVLDYDSSGYSTESTVPLYRSRREFIRDLGIGAAAVPFVLNLPSLGFANQAKRKQRLVIMFSPERRDPRRVLAEGRGRGVHLAGKPLSRWSRSRTRS